jgi:hypothetical protein
MDIKGKLVQLLPLQTGQGKNGQWRKQDIIIETQGQYPKKVCISIWGDKINESQLQIGNELNISFDVESREYNGRWYTDVKAWKVDGAGASSDGGQYNQSREYNPSQEYQQSSSSSAPDESDLPF